MATKQVKEVPGYGNWRFCEQRDPSAGLHARLRACALLTVLAVLSIAATITTSSSVFAADIAEAWRGGAYTLPITVAANQADGTCWVADYTGNAVIHLDTDGTELWHGSSFSTPAYVSVNPVDGSCWAADLGNAEVVHLSADGAELWRGGGFTKPRAISANPTDGSCWVADSAGNKVIHLAEDGTELWSGLGFNAPLSVSVNPADGSCWVSDRGNNQVVHLAEDGTEIWRGGGFNKPISVAVNTADGTCWVADTNNNEVVHLDTDGTELVRGGGFSGNWLVACNPTDSSCWVADTGSNQVVCLAEDGTELWRGDGFNSPYSVSVNAADGSCWVADGANGQVVHLAFQYSLSVAGSNGSVEIDTIPQSLPWSGDFIDGTEVVLEAIPDSTYEFAGWSGDLSGSENPTTVTVTSDMSITANFTKIQYQLDLTGIGDGTVLVDGAEHALPWSGLFDAETSVDLEAVPTSCYDFASWSGDMTGASNPKTITMTAPKSVTANFTQLTYTLQINGTGLGSVSVDGTLRSLPWSGDFLCGETVTLEVAPAVCWQFTAWSGDLTGSDSPTQVVVDGPTSLTANFSQIEYTLSLDAVGAGSMIVDGTPRALPWSGSFLCGDTVALEAVPNSCYEFDSWSGALSGSTNPRIVTMDGAKSVSAHFSKLQYTLDLSGNGSGSVTVDGAEQTLPWSGTFDCGDVVTLDAIPDTCYEFSGWTGDITWASAPVDIVIDGAKSLTANFSQAEYTLSLTGEGGSVLVDGTPQTLPWADTFLCGESVALEAVPGEHRVFSAWSGDLEGSANPTSIVIDGDRAVNASFGYASYNLSITATGDGSVLVDGAPVALPFSQPYVYGTSVVLTAEPGQGTRFSGWSGAVSASEAEVSVEVLGFTSIVALFEPLVDFSDIESDHWAIAAIAACVDAGIVTGFPDGFYRPDLKVDRAAMAVFIARGMVGDGGVPTGPAEATFSDVSSDHWAYDYIEYVAASSIVAGYADGSYQPTWNVTRGQMAVFVARSIVDPTGDEGLASYSPPASASFPDVPTDYWCFAHIEYLLANEIVGGYPDGYYRPTSPVTRDQMAVYIARAFDLLP